MPQKHLAIEVDTGAVRFIKMDGSFVVDHFLCKFSDRQDYRIKNQLKTFIQENNICEEDFESHSLAWMGKESSLVPNSVFASSNAEEIMQLCFGKAIDTSDIDYNRISEMSIVNTYSMPAWVKQFFVINFPRIILQHIGTHAIRGLQKEPGFGLISCISISSSNFRLISFENKEITFYSTFEYSTLEDILYYFSFALQQKEQLEVEQKIILENCVDASVDLDELQTSILKVAKNAEVEQRNYFTANNQLLCV